MMAGLTRPTLASRVGATLYYGGIRSLRIAAVARRLRDTGPILCYHNVVPAGSPRAGDTGLHLPRDRFEAQMRWLVSRYEVVPLGLFSARLAAGATLRGVAAVTFDDGYEGVFSHALPILRSLGIPATVFVVSQATESGAGFWWDQPQVIATATPERRRRWLTELDGHAASILSDAGALGSPALPDALRPASWATIRACAGAGIDIGVHSTTHRALPGLSDAELEHEIVEGRRAIHRATGVWATTFAYPYGLCTPRVRAIVKAAGYGAACGLAAGLNRHDADRWCLRRINVPAGLSDAGFEAWSAGILRTHRP